ncbi:2-C-methyl-D-erythritol 4-phosphate cytidylyltransferase [Dactylosporangium sp. NBC_01737]|uniref:2-C-methyl-D-erythritol 4-phosphate cytidylyltransferase n=1 Tax=Dactylosporangium sp. NBC_01737 TaxID=2975959 RepID=UPI002E15016E|nr:2-C-methyl-D-erythritol 4-phosphate cytidylyltransferase [Dactylosporangium sp. NBC_01737]
MGVRLGPGAPKALRLLRGEPLLVHAVRRVAAAPSVGCIVVAAPADAVDDVRELLSPIVAGETCGVAEPALGTCQLFVVAGGTSRQASVAAALTAVPEEFGIVLVHDAARALTPPELVEAVADAVRGGHGAVIPVLAVVDTIKQVDDFGVVVGTVDRSVLRAVQTPQGFRRDVLTSAHAAAVDEHTDDAGMAEKLGVPVHTVPGSEAAMKITRPFDLAVAELLF